MKTKHLLKRIVVVAFYLAMTTAVKAASTATTFAELQSQFAAAVASGIPSTINIGAAIVVDTNFVMVSTGDTVTLNFVPFGITITKGTLTLGDKVKITSAYTAAGAVQADAGGTVVVNAGSYISSTTGYTVRALAGGTVVVNGGTMVSTATTPVVAAGGEVIINGGNITTSNYPAAASGMSILVSGVATASGGTLTINDGYIATKATGIARGVGIDYNGICIINGGEIHSDGGGGRAVSINATNAGGKLFVNGGTITAIGATGRAIQVDNNNASAWIAGSPVITGGLEAIMVQKMGVVVVSGSPVLTGVIGTNAATAKLYDARTITPIVATPGTGLYGAPQLVTLSGATESIYKYVNTTSQASATVVGATLVYTTDGTTPVAASTVYTIPFTVASPSVLNVAPYIETTVVGSATTFNYTMPVTQVTDSATFAAALATMKTTGGGTIELLNDITIRPSKGLANAYVLASDAVNPIQINTKQFKIIASGTGATGDSSSLVIGNNVDIYGTAVVLNNVNRGMIRVVGGSVKTTASYPGISNPAAIQTNSGWVFVSGGKVSVEVAVPTTAYGIYMDNYMSTVITGGTISAIGDNTRAVRISDGSATVISGATITANGNSAYALQALGGLLMTIGNDLTVTTTSADGTDAALVSGGATSRIIIPSTATNVSITSSHKYKLDNTAAAVLDMRDVTLTANPVSGTAFVNPSNVVLTASGNESMSLAGIYYSYDAVPTTSSSNINSGGSVLAPFATTTIKASIGKAGYIDPILYTYIYTVQNPLQITLISTFAQLKDAYTASLTASDTTRLKLTANIITDAEFTMTPDATHPIILDANGFYIQTGVSASTFTTTFGGSLKVISTLSTGSGIFKLMGQTVTNITGGSYTLYGNGQILFANSGSGVNVNTTKLNLSDATFVVIGTSNAASIVKFGTSDGNLISATNCNFMVNAKGVAFSCVGPQYITIKNCTLTIGGNDATSIAFSQSPTNAVNKSDLTVDGLMLNMAAGKVFTWGGSKNINTVIKDLELIGSAVIEKPTTGTGTVRKFYDFRADTLKTTPAAGEYAANQSVVLSMAVGSAYDADSATLVYTLDGTEPTALSTVYSAPIVTNDSTTLIKVAALKDGFLGKSVLFTYKKAVISGQPTVGAPTPPALAAAKVVSIFSDAFTSATGTNFNPNWGQSTVYSALQIGGNNTIKYANLNYQGMALANPVNAVAMTTLHIDVWTADETSLQITPISPGTPNKEFSVPLTPLVQNSWNSFDVPLSAFTGVSMADVFQFKVVGSGGKTVYLDNLYFYNNSTAEDTEAPTAFTATAGAITHNSIELLLNATDNSGAVTYGITFGDTTLFTGGVSGVQKSFVINGLTPLTDYSFSVAAKDLTGNVAANSPIVVSAKTAVGFAVPTVSAPTPTAAANKVISIYSNAYTNVAGTNFNPYWNQNTLVTTFNIGADAILKYENFNYQGTEFGSDVDASGMTKMHVDVFTPNETSVKVQPISHTGGGIAVALTPLTLNAWNSFDIPLTSFNQATNNLFQLMFSTGTGKIVYLDNIYFFNDTVAVSVSKPKASNDVTIYPTLVSNTITLVSGSEMSQVVVRNLLGQTVKTFGIDKREITLDLSDVTTGNYFMTIKLANGQYTTQKFVKL